jgi:hypothetical protein
MRAPALARRPFTGTAAAACSSLLQPVGEGLQGVIAALDLDSPFPTARVDGAPGLENAIAAVWDGVPVQRCRNLLAHAPERLHEEGNGVFRVR